MMADQALAEPVIDQPGVADGAGEAMAAGAAQRQRRIAAAIQEQQRLFAAAPRDWICSARTGGEPAAARGGARRRSIASICGMC